MVGEKTPEKRRRREDALDYILSGDHVVALAEEIAEEIRLRNTSSNTAAYVVLNALQEAIKAGCKTFREKNGRKEQPWSREN